MGFAGCSSLPVKGDPRLKAELSRTLGVPQGEFQWVAAVDWSRHEGWWQPSFGADFFRGTIGLFLGDATSTGVLLEDALVIARSSDFSVSYRVLQRIALEDIERVTLLDDGIVVLKRSGSGEVRDYVRVLSVDPWLADQLLFGPSVELAESLTRQLKARVRPPPSRWRPEPLPGDKERTVALLTPRAVPVVTFPPPPGSADKGPVAGTGATAKGLLQAGEGLGTLSPQLGLPLGVAGMVVQAVGSLAGAAQGSLSELSEPDARAASARLEALQKAGLPTAELSTLANGMLLEAIASRVARADAPGAADDVDALVPIEEAKTGAPDNFAARAALGEDGFDRVWQLEVTAIELRVVTPVGDGPVADPQVAMRIVARLQRSRSGAAFGKGRDIASTEIDDVGAALALHDWAANGGERLRTEFRAACERLATRFAEDEMAHSIWLPPRR